MLNFKNLFPDPNKFAAKLLHIKLLKDSSYMVRKQCFGGLGGPENLFVFISFQYSF